MSLFGSLKKALKPTSSSARSSSGVARAAEVSRQSDTAPYVPRTMDTFAPLEDGVSRVLGMTDNMGSVTFWVGSKRISSVRYAVGVSRYNGETYLIACLAPNRVHSLVQTANFPKYLNLGLLEGLLHSEVRVLTEEDPKEGTYVRGVERFNLSRRLLSSFDTMGENSPILTQADVRWFDDSIALAFLYLHNGGSIHSGTTHVTTDDFISRDGSLLLRCDGFFEGGLLLLRGFEKMSFSTLMFMSYLGALPTEKTFKSLKVHVSDESLHVAREVLKTAKPENCGVLPEQYFGVNPYNFKVVGSRPFKLVLTTSDVEGSPSTARVSKPQEVSNSNIYELGQVYYYENLTPVILTTKKDGKLEFVLLEVISSLMKMYNSGQAFEDSGFKVNSDGVYFKFNNGNPPLYLGKPVAIYLDESSASSVITPTRKYLNNSKLYFHTNNRSGEVKLTVQDV